MGSIPVANPAPRRRSGAMRRGVAAAVIALLAGTWIVTWSPLGWVDAGRPRNAGSDSIPGAPLMPRRDPVTLE